VVWDQRPDSTLIATEVVSERDWTRKIKRSFGGFCLLLLRDPFILRDPFT